MEKVLITGMGSVSALGRNNGMFWAGLNSGKSGISEITAFSREHLRNTQAGEVKMWPELARYAEKTGIRSRLSLFAHWAIEEALADSGLQREGLKGRRVGLVLGVSLGMSLVKESLECDDNALESALNTSDDFSDLVDEVAENFGILGEAVVVSTACASGANAIGIARDMICHEGYDIVISGGVDTLDRMKYLGHTGLNTLTPAAIKPFTSERNGTLFGEGAGIFVLERDQLLGKRTPHAVCSGAGYSCDAMHVTAPDETGAGAIHVMQQALTDADVSPDAIGYINLHGSGTPLNDAMESRAVEEVFGEKAASMPVSSIKPAIGHTMGAAGALESVATALSIKHQCIPPTLNVSADEAPVFPLRIVRDHAIEAPISHALSNSFGFGGCNGAVLISKWEE